MKYYIAYGSNLNVEQMKWRCPGAVIVGTSILKGWRLAFKGSKTGSYLTIEESAGDEVPVAIWRVTQRDEAALDRYEGYPTFYYKRDLRITDWQFSDGVPGEKSITAMVYIMHENRPYGVPSKFYIDVCSEGYREFGFDIGFLDRAYDQSLVRSKLKVV